MKSSTSAVKARPAQPKKTDPVAAKPALKKEKENLPLWKIPEVIWAMITNPKSNIDVIRKTCLVLPISAIPLWIGLMFRRRLDHQIPNLINQTQSSLNSLDSTLAQIYPFAFIGMMTSGTLNGFGSYASPSRTLAYGSLMMTSIYNLLIERGITKTLAKIQDLRKKLESADPQEKALIQEEIDKLTSSISSDVGYLALYARSIFPVLMNFTFFANAVQALDGFSVHEAKGSNLKSLWQSIRHNWGKNLSNEFKAAKEITFHRLFSPKEWADTFRTFAGKNPGFEKKLDMEGIRGFERIIQRFHYNRFTGNFLFLNMYTRAISAILTFIAVNAWSKGISNPSKVFLNEDPQYQKADPEVQKLHELGNGSKKWALNLFNAATAIGNVGLFSLGISSILMNNKTYRGKAGVLAGSLQTVGGSLLIASSFCDQNHFYLLASTLRIMSNAVLQFANIFGAANKEVSNLVNNGVIKLKR